MNNTILKDFREIRRHENKLYYNGKFICETTTDAAKRIIDNWQVELIKNNIDFDVKQYDHIGDHIVKSNTQIKNYMDSDGIVDAYEYWLKNRKKQPVYRK